MNIGYYHMFKKKNTTLMYEKPLNSDEISKHFVFRFVAHRQENQIQKHLHSFVE